MTATAMPPLSKTHTRAAKSLRPRALEFALEAGNTMLAGYPYGNYAGKVFLVLEIDQAKGVTLLQTNSPILVIKDTNGTTSPVSLGTLLKKAINIPAEHDMQAFLGGNCDSDLDIRLITPLDWHPEIDSITAGPFRIHDELDAFKTVASGDKPERACLFVGQLTLSYPDFLEAFRQYEFGEISTVDDFIYDSSTASSQWQRAMDIHTGGRLLTVPHAYLLPSTRGKNVEIIQPLPM